MADVRDELQRALGSAYILEHELGGGAMSRVFVATETALGRRVVIKLLPPDLGAAVSAERFRREIQLAARLQHPHIVPLLTAGTAGGTVYYTMPFVEGASLRALLQRKGELPIAEAIALLRGVASALAYAHQHGVVHRDIKPDNVLVSGEYALVSDFGVAKAVVQASQADRSEALTSRGVALGTPAYMAPEQSAADPLTDHRADIYAFGCVAYEALTGRMVFEGRSVQALLAAHAIEPAESIVRRRAAVPQALAAIVMRCLEKRPADRPQSADEIVRALDAAAGITSGGAMSAQRQMRVSRRGIVIGSVAAVLLIAAVLLTKRGSPAPAADAGVVAVLPFRVTSADPSLQYLREGMVDLLAAKLADTPRALDPRAVLGSWQRAGGSEKTDLDPARSQRLASDLGAGRLLQGEIVGSAARVVLSARINEAPGGRERARASATGAVADLAVLVDSLTARLLALDAGEDRARATMLGGVPLPALQAYLAGQRAMRAGEYQHAADAFARAVEIDSSFAIAAVRLYTATDWLPSDPRGTQAGQLAALHRDRIGPRDQWLLPVVDPRQQGTTVADAIARAEQATTAVPDMPELWYRLGDLYHHFGPLLSLPDVERRSARALERALALDSTFRPAFEHLTAVYETMGDTAGVRRGNARLARDTTGDFWPVTMFRTATSAAGRTAATERLLRGPVPFAVIPVTATPEHWEWTPETDELLRRLSEHATSESDRRLVAVTSYIAAMNRGQPTRGARAYDPSMLPEHPAYALDALFWDGDSAAAAPRLAALARVAAARAAPPVPERQPWIDATLVVAQAALARNDTAGVADAVRRLLAAPPIDTLPRLTQLARWNALLIDTQLAAAGRRADAAERLASLDSVLRLGPFDITMRAVGNLVAARLWEQRGDLPRARAALFRTTRGPAPTPFASTYLRERARLSALTGDRETAIRDYRRYLGARGNAEPALAQHVASVRAELERLEREGRGR